jgi:hypothetical protein
MDTNNSLQQHDIDDEWENFCEHDEYYTISTQELDKDKNNTETDPNDINISKVPTPSKLYISTTTIISYLNIPIDINNIFWKIPIIPYATPSIGVVKKQMKFISSSQEQLNCINEKIKYYEYVDNLLISKVDKPNTRTKFKEVRKVSIGICRKDITSYRCKKKGAFMNCFVVILRIMTEGKYKEIHVKVFNTGKLEIPGIQSSDILDDVLTLLINILSPIVNSNEPIVYLKDKSETVLINSNFNCGFYIDREKLYEKLKYVYNINSVYDPCSYPGIQCDYYYSNDNNNIDDNKDLIQLLNNENTENTENTENECADEKKTKKQKISFMIFRTGSVLIVGKCPEIILHKLYKFLCNILINEYNYIKVNNMDNPTKNKNNKNKIPKIRKKILNNN